MLTEQIIHLSSVFTPHEEINILGYKNSGEQTELLFWNGITENQEGNDLAKVTKSYCIIIQVLCL